MRKLILSCLCLAFSVVVTFWTANKMLLNKTKIPHVIYIKHGDGINKVGAALYSAGVIKSANVFKLFGLFLVKIGYIQDIKYGEYTIDSQSLISFFYKLKNEKTIVHQITFPEGITTSEFIDIINNNEILLGENVTFDKEGYLMPETYFFKKGDTRASILETAERAMQDFLAANSELILHHESYKGDYHRLLTLASIVEKETPIEAEKPIIAQVYLNRLKVNMKLQADPTVIYGITNGRNTFTKKVTYEDLKNPSPYNTYKHKGLPPTPIGNPGKKSIIACLAPQPHSYIYFVANGRGGHIFAENYKQHLANVQNYRSLNAKK